MSGTPVRATGHSSEFTDLQFAPNRVLFVSPVWPVGFDETRYFMKIADALAKAVTLSPTEAAPVIIRIAPGTYSESLSLVSNVHLAGWSRGSTVLSGVMTWTPAAGVNAPQAGDIETVVISQVAFSNTVSTFTADASGKPGATFTQLLFLDCSMASPGLTHIGRPGTQDVVFINNMTPTGGLGFPALTFTNTLARIFGSFILSITETSTSTNTIEFFGTGVSGITLISGHIRAFGSDITGLIAVSGGGALFQANNTNLEDISVGAGSSALLQNSRYLTLTGPGGINRTLTQFTIGPTLVGDNDIAIPGAPFVDAQYSVLLEYQVSGPVATVRGKTANSFILNDPAGARTFDVIIKRMT